MKPADILQMNVIVEAKAPRHDLLKAESGMGAPEMGVDDHLHHAVQHAHASLQATRSGQADQAEHHATVAKSHLMQAHQKQKAADRPEAHPGEKMVFGVWRKVGQLTPADHQKIGDAYTAHAKRTKAKVDAYGMLSGVHPSEHKPEDAARHYHGVKQSLMAAKMHYSGHDPHVHTPGAGGVSRTGGAAPRVHDQPAG